MKTLLIVLALSSVALAADLPVPPPMKIGVSPVGESPSHHHRPPHGPKKSHR